MKDPVEDHVEEFADKLPEETPKKTHVFCGGIRGGLVKEFH